jgi:PAS domain S-box-containing protein
MSLDTFQALLPYLASLALALGCSFLLWRRRTVRGALPYALILLTQASWTFGYIFELINPTLAGKLAWDDFQFIGSNAAPLAVLAFALVYTDKRLPRPRVFWGTQIGLLVISLALVYTDGWHGLIRISGHLVTVPPFDALVYNFGPTLWLIVLWLYGNTLAGLGLLLVHLFRQHGLYRLQTAYILIGLLIPVAGTILGLAGITLGGQRDVTPFTFGVGNLLLAWGLFRYRTFDVRPVARDTVLENILEAVIILDDRQVVVDLNAAARRLFASHDLMGQPFAHAFAPWPVLRQACQLPGPAKVELSLDQRGQPTYFAFEYSPLTDPQGQVNGYLLVLRDIHSLRQTQAELEQRVATRSAELSAANAELTQANLALQAEMVERERTGEVLRQQQAAALRLAQEGLEARQAMETAQARLRESERNYREIFNATSEAIFIHDVPNGKLRQVNTSMPLMYGYTSEAEVLGLVVGDLSGNMPPYTQAEAEAHIRRTLEAGPQVFEWLARKKNGEQFWVEVSLRNTQIGGENRILGVVRDVNERKRAEAALRHKSQQTQALMELSSLLLEAGHSYQTVLDQAVQRSAELIGDGASLFLYTPGQPHLELAAVYNPDPEAAAYFRTYMEANPIRADEGSYGQVIRTREPVLLPEVDMQRVLASASAERRVYYEKLPVYSAMFAPLKAEGECIGVLGVARHNPDHPHFTTDELPFFQEVADRAAVAISQARMYVALKKELAERKQAEEALRQSERRLLEAQAIAHVGNWELTLGNQSFWGSEEVFCIFGVERVLPFLPLAEVRERLHPDDRPRVAQATATLLRQGGEYDLEHRILRRTDGALRMVHSWAHLAIDEAGAPYKIIGVMQDVTEAKLAEHELEQHRFHLEELVKERTRELEQSRAAALNLMQDAEQARARAEALLTELKESEAALIAAKEAAEAASQAKSVFVANMSHEIRTPMNAIVGLTHLVLAGPLSAQQRDYMAKVQASAHHLLSIINDILDFSKMEADKIEIEAVPFDLNQIFESLAAMTSTWISDKPLEVIFDTAPEVPMYLVGDPLRVEQVLINLGTNAAKFTTAGEVVFSTRVAAQAADGVTLEFSVRDTGIGMTPEQMGHLFTAFSQGDAATTRQFGGTGLGLAITKRLVELMGGSIRVESQPGRGSCFTFSLPFKRAAAPPPLPADGLGLVKALVVEDNLTAQEVLQNYLRAVVGEVNAVATGEAALDRLAAEPYDLVFLDWHLPGIDGVETVRRLKAQPALYFNPHIIFVAAYGREQIVWQARELGVDAVLIKPASPASLFDALLKAFRSEGTAPLAKPARGAQPHLAGARVLVVEDNVINQDVAQGLLQQAGVQVTVADSGEAALALLATHSFDAVLMDVQMPGLDGYEATRRIRLNPAWASLPIIAMTAHAMVADRGKSLGAGMNDHVNKPVAPAELYAALARWLPVPPVSPEKAIRPAPSRQVLHVSEGQYHTGGEADYVRLLGRFLSEYRDVAEIKAALASTDIARAQLLAHSLKGVAAMLGAEELQQSAKALEAALRQTSLAPWEALVRQVEQDLEAARAAMVAFRENAP